ncbi:MAG: exo-alpha-sialidase [Actinomycetota bacterium]|nr:exo-alpha-sialidase [Actinomycetota bacterium]
MRRADLLSVGPEESIVRAVRLMLVLAFAVMLGLIAGQGAWAADPPRGKVSAKPGGGSDTLTYTGEVPAGTGSLVDCEEGVNADLFRLTVEGTDDSSIDTFLTIRIEWDPTIGQEALNDLALQVYKDGNLVAESDGGTSREVVGLQNPEPGRYDVYSCAFSNATPQPYKGQVSLNATPKQAQALPEASDPRGLKFMPIVTVDPQRDVAEPSLRIDKDGNIYECGPFGSSRAADYATKSEDGGDTFRVLGEPPEGRIAPGGGGDCELSVATKRNDLGNYTLSYTGLEALLNFSTGKSEDDGENFLSQVFSNSVPLVDRQWMESHGKNEVYLFYNQIPFGGTLQRSTDGGLTYDFASNLGNAAPEIFRPGNIIIDHNPDHNPVMNQEIVYGTYTNGNKVMVFRSYDQGQTFSRFEVVTAEGRPDNLFPSIDIDTGGNLYVAWIEKGSFNAYYSYSKNRGRTWSEKQQVNREGASTTVMPWISAGSPGRVAVSFYCSPVDGNPEIGDNTETPKEEGFKGPWGVCMNQSLNALGQGADFSQVKVTHHPIHWDSICLSGLACDTNGGDRTLLDFFQNRIDPRDGRLSVVFNESNKRPRVDETGPIAIVTYAKQKSGPSLYESQGTVPADPRDIVRSSSTDPTGDAEFDFSSLRPTPPPRRNDVPSLDITSLKASPSTIGDEKAIKFDLKVDGDLTRDALLDAAAEMNSVELKYVIRWFSAYRPDYLVANYEVSTDTFGFFEGNLNMARCEQSADGKLEVYPAPGVDRLEVPGRVDPATNTITLKIPYREIQDFDLNPNDPTQEPQRDRATSGDPIWEVTAFTFGRPRDDEPQQGPGGEAVCTVADYYNQADSTPSFDYRLP